LSAEFVWRMEDVLDLYEESRDPKRPVVCFDEMPYRMVAETRIPVAAKPGHPARHDYEYERRGTRNIFASFEPKAGWRRLDVTERRTAVDFAHAMLRLADEHYPEAEKVRVVLDNLNTHTPASLYKAFEPAEARRILRKLEFHHTPKHASWLNQVEIELSALSRQCLERRIPDAERLTREIGAWERERNEKGATVRWRFTASEAREKLARLYPAQP
jgi:DDE superfamily endonuclease